MGASIGVDSHKGSLAAAAVDELGRVLGVREFPNDPGGHRALLAWARSYEDRGAIGIEGSGAYGAGLCRMLTSAGEQVVEVPSTLTFRERRRKASKGKSDAVDAVAIARVVARGEDLPSPVRDQALVDLKLLSDYRDQLVHAPSSPTGSTGTSLFFIPVTSGRCPTSLASSILPRPCPS